MQRLEVSDAVGPLEWSLRVKGLNQLTKDARCLRRVHSVTNVALLCV